MLQKVNNFTGTAVTTDRTSNVSYGQKLTIKFGELPVAENGMISENYDEEKLKEYMKWESILIEVNLNQGSDSFECYTCDFTHDYIDINADYRN